ncbi:hypothetical protein SLEP1_g29532 [Rubroshorea leprosula]|nr:hypothetical protein SLEP1_g29532 [Rubroshorea leprosula]
MIRKEKFDMVFIQETKLEVMDYRGCKAIWGSGEFDWNMKPAVGNAGGMLCLWNKNSIKAQSRIEGDGFVGSMVSGAMRNFLAFLLMYMPLAIDRKGKGSRRSQSEFNDFLMENELVDIPLRGRKFTWYKSNGLAVGGLAFVKKKWTSFDVRGWGGFRLKEKLKFLKKELKVWNKEVFGIIETQIEAAKEEIKKVDEKNDVGTLEETDIAKRIASFQELMEWTNARNNLLFQKARQQWLKEGDSNSKYFHNCVVRRRKQNELVGLLHNGVWVDRVEEVKSIVKDFFSNKFTKEEWCMPLLEEIKFNQRSSMQERGFVKGLRQGDPLSPFLFLVVAEALSGLVRKAEEIGLLKGIQVGEGNLRLTHLQCADDTILFSEASEANAWAMKCVMRSFEMISGLKVNNDKSWLCGLNVDSERLEDMATIMNCSVSSIPFKYLGVPVGANTNRISTWAPVIECVKRRLNRWSGVSLSFGGRIVLLKAVLSYLPVYFFYVYKAPKQVTNLLTKLQCNFLWGRGEGGRNIAWIKWDVICKYREEGGLGVRNVESFNKALLGKWKWRVLREKEVLWRRVIYELYGIDGGRGWGRWLREGFVKRVGEGKDTFFWDDMWVGDVNLKENFPRLYSITTNKNVKVAELGEWCEGVWVWKWNWRRDLFAWELDLLQELEDTIRPVSINRGTEDVWIWKWDNSGQYTVRLAYQQLLPAQQVQSLQAPFIQVWNPHVPLKVSALAWRALHDRLPTKSNLARRGVITNGGGIQCSNCLKKEETINHLMFECPLSWKVWTSCYSWWGISTAINVDTTTHFKQHTGLIDSKNINQAWAVIWFAALWSIWLQRNQVIFNSNHDSLEEMLELIKYRSFYWIRAMPQPELSLDLWKSNPRLALRMR